MKIIKSNEDRLKVIFENQIYDKQKLMVKNIRWNGV